MIEFTSEIKTIPYSRQIVYSVLSDLNNLEIIRGNVKSETMSSITFDRDSCTFSVGSLGLFKLVVVDREAEEKIKFETEQSSINININMLIQLLSIGADITKMKLIVQAKLSPILKSILLKSIREGIEKIATILTEIPYNEIVAKK